MSSVKRWTAEQNSV